VTHIYFRKGVLIAAMLLASSVVLAQGTAPAQPAKPAIPPATTPAPGATTPGAAAAAPAPEPYTYNPEGRRDPFVSLILRGVEAVSAGQVHSHHQAPV